MTSLLLKLVEASVSMLSLIDLDREAVGSDEDDGSRVVEDSWEDEGGGGSSELDGPSESSELDDDGDIESSSEEDSEGVGDGGWSEMDCSRDEED